MWATSPLDDLCEAIVDCPHSTPAWTDSGEIVLRSKNIKNGRLDLSDPSFTDSEHYARRTKRAEPRPGDLVITREAPMGEVCMIPDGTKCCLGQRMVLLRPDPLEADSRFLLYALQSPMVQYEIGASEGTGSTVSNLRIPLLEALKIPKPNIQEQRAIAHILGTIDDKIELNRRMNETLEAMARAIFKSWFVDFEPVRAKIDGRQPPGMRPEIAALFPASLEDSELGGVPQGWRAGTILETCDLLSGGTPKTSKSHYWNGDIQWASAKDVSQCGDSFLIKTERKITEAGLAESSTKLIDPFSTVVVARGATTGRMTMLGDTIAMNQTCYALRSKNQVPFFVYCHARLFVDDLVFAAHGSVFDTITTRTFDASSVVIPEPETARAFDDLVRPMFLRVLANVSESASLEETRDDLLPKLLSGDICMNNRMDG